MIALALLAVLALPQDPLDAVVAAPGNHVVVLENDRVRVLQVTVRPGETEPVHVHRWPSIMQIQSAQPLTDILYEEEDGRLVEVRRVALPEGPPPPALWFEPEGPHAIHNGGDAPFRALRIELKTAD
jgi:hypothetical protein